MDSKESCQALEKKSTFRSEGYYNCRADLSAFFGSEKYDFRPEAAFFQLFFFEDDLRFVF